MRAPSAPSPETHPVGRIPSFFDPLDMAHFLAGYPSKPATFNHLLAGNPAFALPRLMVLAGTLRKSSVRIERDGSVDETLSASTAIHGLVQSNDVVELRDVDQHPDIGAVVTDGMRTLNAAARGVRERPTDQDARLFLASPGRPLPADPSSHSLWLIIRGTIDLGTERLNSGNAFFQPAGHEITPHTADDMAIALVLRWRTKNLQRLDEAAQFDKMFGRQTSAQKTGTETTTRLKAALYRVISRKGSQKGRRRS